MQYYITIKPNGIQTVEYKGDRSVLKALQEEIGGYIEIVPLIHDFMIVVDEDGIAKELPINPIVSFMYGEVIRGNAVVVKMNEEHDDIEFFDDEKIKPEDIAKALGI